jgi:co-chaperonin GroES (HSP10)
MSDTKFELKGNRLMIERPMRPESAITLTPEVEKKLDQDMIKKWTSLSVFAVGDKVEMDLKPGDQVYIAPDCLPSAGHMEIDGKSYLIVREYDVMIVWK